MTPADLLLDAYGRLPDLVQEAVEGLDERQLAHRLDPQANTVAWLVWHLARVEDEAVAAAFGGGQVYLDDGWAERFGLPADADDTGYGHDAAQVAAVRADAPLLCGYYAAVAERTAQHLRTVRESDLDRVVDRSYDPPVTLGVRLVSVVEDATQHVGQAALLRGLILRS